MTLPVRITFRNMEPRPAVTAAASRRLERLGRRFVQIAGCHVVVELQPHRQYRVSLEIDASGSLIVVSHEPPRPHLADALAGAFRAAASELAGRARHAAKKGRVVALSRSHGFGYLADEEGRTIFFGARCVRGGLDAVYTGAPVRFVADDGEASEVDPG